ncbi:MAG: GNAT family N-acetyltransferase [Peptoniphilus sp.]|uniref:GNAT family N-acetyltransferase n=1 Tax=Peptoniphilus sp. TaxID=1971214 RepID=UPI002A76269C|nr:GNAT family N-acetyltransferase [Peptoniphilus sp.]MDY2986611.1 GNAT family N-acetyltransferase [Peptoniphilus sp.]
MDHKGTVKLETERLILKKFSLDDSEQVFKNWANEDEVTEFLRWKSHNNIEVTKNILSEWIKSYKNLDFYQWSIVLKETEESIGTISVVGMDEMTNKVHIGYCLGSKWWNLGIMSEAFSKVISFLFEKVGVKRIESQYDPENVGSGKVMKKCGLVYEGTLRNADWSNRGIVDACMYSILAEEYFRNI